MVSVFNDCASVSLNFRVTPLIRDLHEPQPPLVCANILSRVSLTINTRFQILLTACVSLRADPRKSGKEHSLFTLRKFQREVGHGLLTSKNIYLPPRIINGREREGGMVNGRVPPSSWHDFHENAFIPRDERVRS